MKSAVDDLIDSIMERLPQEGKPMPRYTFMLDLIASAVKWKVPAVVEEAMYAAQTVAFECQDCETISRVGRHKQHCPSRKGRWSSGGCVRLIYAGKEPK